MTGQPNIYLVTGTDTNVGKSVVTGWLAAELAGRRRVAVVKAVQTGAAQDSEGDAATYARLAAGRAVTIETLLSFAEPMAPAIAARREGRDIDLQALAEQALHIARSHDVTLVEGSGGLLVPIDREGRDFRDFAEALGASLIVVASPGLGTLNHTLLTLEAAQVRGLPVIFLVLDGMSFTPTQVELENIAFLAGRLPQTPLIVLRHDPDLRVDGFQPMLIAGGAWPGAPLSPAWLAGMLTP